jgi:excinuclease UvrABC nuclease subunit
MARSTTLARKKAELQPYLQALPAASGVYRFYDVTGALIYVGKSVCLRDRVRSYFTGTATTKKLRRLRQEICRIEWDETGSELEALLLESRMVKRHQPRFNVMLKGFVPLPYVRIDQDDPFPVLEVTRSPAPDGATYFGPFHRQQALEAAVGGLSDALRLRTCATPGDRLVGQRPCYRYEFGTCAAPCLGEVDEEEYALSIARASAVFEGREQSAMETLRERMERAAERLQFEIAARLRDAIKHVQAVSGRQHALVSAVRGLNLVAACPSRHSDSLSLFVFCSGRLVLQEDVPTEALCESAARREWAERLVVAGLSLPPASAANIDSGVLDEVQIVTAWMRQKTREGEYWPIDPAGEPWALAAQLEGWLAARAAVAPARLAA